MPYALCLLRQTASPTMLATARMRSTIHSIGLLRSPVRGLVFPVDFADPEDPDFTEVFADPEDPDFTEVFDDPALPAAFTEGFGLIVSFVPTLPSLKWNVTVWSPSESVSR